MLQAELHNKDRRNSLICDMEDVLTSNVFGVLKNVDNYFFGKVLNVALGVSPKRDKFLKVDFWPTEYKYDTGLGFAAEPDCLIAGDDFFVLVEAKYHADFGEGIDSSVKIENQLKREYELLVKHSELNSYSISKCFLLVVTDDIFEPKEKIREQFGSRTFPKNICWISWEKICFILKKAIRQYDNRCEVSKKWIEDLVELLENKGFRDFRGFGDLVDGPKLDASIIKKEFLFLNKQGGLMERNELNNLPKQIDLAQQILLKFFNEIAFLIKAIEKQLNEHIMVKTQGYAVAASGSRGINMPKDWLSSFFAVMFVPKTFVSFVGREGKKGVEKGKTVTKIEPSLRAFFFKVVIRSDDIQEPELWFGILSDIRTSSLKVVKLEDRVQKFFDNLTFDKEWLGSDGPFEIKQNEGDFCYKGTLKRTKLFPLSDPNDVERIITDLKKWY